MDLFRCDTCLMWECVDDVPNDSNFFIGECHRYPPNQYEGGKFNDPDSSKLPSTYAEDWCGEWKQKVN